MELNLPTLNDFMMVESLAHHMSINSAAKELEISPSALSRQLSSLESKLGIRIFERDTRNFSLTESGNKFLQVAEKVLYETENNLNRFKPYLKSRIKRLTISALPTVTGVLLPKLLNNFSTIHPEINLIVNDEHTPKVISSIENGQVDLGLTVGTVTIRSKLSFTPLVDENFVVVSSKKDLSISKDQYSLKEIVDFPVISAKKGTSYRDYIDSVCEREKLHFAPKIEVTQLDTAVAMVSEGLGITILPVLILPILSTKNIKFHRVREFEVPNKIGIAYSSDRVLSPAANFFLNHVIGETQHLYESIRDEFSI